MAHIHEKIDWCAGVYIVHQNKVLLRLHDKYKFWGEVGGHIELDEDPVTAAKRECKEEVGLDVKIYGEDKCTVATDEVNRDLVVPAFMNIHKINDTHQHIGIIYYATSDSMDVIPESPDDEWVWLTREEVEQHPNLRNKVRQYALGALDTLAS